MKEAEVSLEVTERVREVIEPALLADGIELVDIEYLSEHGRWILRLYIDTADGITIDQISLASREISTLLDVEDMIRGRYSLEVSSPGLDRPLTKPEHFIRAKGKAVRIKIKASGGEEGRRRFSGIIESVGEEGVELLDKDGNSHSIPFVDIEKARLEVVV